MTHLPSASPSPQPLLLAGPTAVGKSDIALHLAEHLGGEIVSVDSMQVYRGLDIGTAKPAAAERARVPHHLIDVVDLAEPFDAAQFARQAQQAVQQIQARGRVAIVCGGTGLYFKAFLEGLGEVPPADAQLRAELEALSLRTLLAELQRRDPATFERIDRHNPRRVVRAVEILRLTGRPLSGQRADWDSARRTAPHAGRFVGFSRAPDDLRARIDARVDAMFARGLVAETAALLTRGLERNRTALQAIGYRQVVEHLRGERTRAETVALVKTRTWQFAKRQMTWFRHQAPELRWLSLAPDEPVEQTVNRLWALWEANSRLSSPVPAGTQ